MGGRVEIERAWGVVVRWCSGNVILRIQIYSKVIKIDIDRVIISIGLFTGKES